MIKTLLMSAFFWLLAGACYATLRRYPGNVLLVSVGVLSAILGSIFIIISSLE